MYFERIIFSDGYSISRQEVIDWANDKKGSPFPGVNSISNLLDQMKILSKLYTKETIDDYFFHLSEKQPLEGKLKDLHEMTYLMHLSKNRLNAIEFIMKEFCKEQNKTNSITPEAYNEDLKHLRADMEKLQATLEKIVDKLNKHETPGPTK